MVPLATTLMEPVGAWLAAADVEVLEEELDVPLAEEDELEALDELDVALCEVEEDVDLPESLGLAEQPAKARATTVRTARRATMRMPVRRSVSL
jgi:hypothetical protein